VWLVLGSKDLSSFSFGFHWLETGFTLCAEQLLNQILLGLLDILIAFFQTFFFPLQFPFHFLSGFSGLDVTNHAVEVSEERFGMVINIGFLFSINTEVISLLKGSFIDI
jgi:hypothetical protein